MDRVFDLLYTRFILRDLFAKMVPGATFLYVLLRANSIDVGDLEAPPFAVWLLLYGAAWVSGVALQSAGEWLRLIRYHQQPRDEDHWRMRLELGEICSPTERQEIERCVVLKEACGNGAVALLASALCLLGMCSFAEEPRGVFKECAWEILTAAALFAPLLRMHRHMVAVQERFTTVLIDQRRRRPYRGDEQKVARDLAR